MTARGYGGTRIAERSTAKARRYTHLRMASAADTEVATSGGEGSIGLGMQKAPPAFVFRSRLDRFSASEGLHRARHRYVCYALSRKSASAQLIITSSFDRLVR